jgi:hypothetical protein
MTFQPVLPIPLYGTGEDEWRLITRPVVPVLFSAPVPRGLDEFDHKGGLADIQVPFVVKLPDRIAGNWLLAAGPEFYLPTGTSDAFSKDQWGLGPSVLVGYKTDTWIAGIFPAYTWKTGSSGQDRSTPDLSQGSMLYFFTANLSDAWQFGFNPTITYNRRASPGNKSNVPVGMFVGKTVRLGNVPVNIKVGLEYSVVRPDDFGQQAQIRLQITPVIPALIDTPIFGGRR